MLYLLLAVSLFSAPASNDVPCAKLRPAVEELDDQFRVLQTKYTDGALSTSKYRKKLVRLRDKELKLYEQARNCSFEDMTTYNYWYRSRLKFPSIIQQALEQLDL